MGWEAFSYQTDNILQLFLHYNCSTCSSGCTTTIIHSSRGVQLPTINTTSRLDELTILTSSLTLGLAEEVLLHQCDTDRRIIRSQQHSSNYVFLFMIMIIINDEATTKNFYYYFMMKLILWFSFCFY